MDLQFQPQEQHVVASLQSELARAQQRVIYLGACLQQMQVEANARIADLQAQLVEKEETKS